MSKFVIFAHARSGSNSLSKVLAESSDVKMTIEPFNPNYTEWNPNERDYSKYVKNIDLMNKAIDEIFSKHTAIKVLDYQLSFKKYSILLSREDLKIILLRRKKLFGAALSTAVAHRTNRWEKQSDEVIYSKLGAIPPEEIGGWIDYVSDLQNTYYDFLQKNRTNDFKLVYYEDLYVDDFDTNKRNIIEISEFLEIAVPDDAFIQKFMDPSKAKINYNNTYKDIPNHKELVKLFGDK